MLGEEVSVKVEGWCKVCHQSTDFLMIGTITTPKTARIDTALSPLVLFSIDE